MRLKLAVCLVLLAIFLTECECRGRRRSRKRVKSQEGIHVKLNEGEEQREQKLFSLFNVVQFANDVCNSTAKSSSGDKLQGVCYSASECMDKSGSAKGSCAAGFGVCCVFDFPAGEESSYTISAPVAYLSSPSSTDDDTELDVTYTVQKSDDGET